MKVWVTNDEPLAHTTFHRSGSCRKLRAGIVSTGNVREPKEVDFDPERHRRPCRACFPSAPRPDIENRSKRFRCACTSRARLTPCEHNGGVLVEIEMPGRWRSTPTGPVWDPEASYTRRMYVWPESAGRHRVVDERLADVI